MDEQSKLEVALNVVNLLAPKRPLTGGEESLYERSIAVVAEYLNEPGAQRTIRDLPIEELHLSVRACCCLANAGIDTVGELLECTAAQLLDIEHFAETTLNEVQSKLGVLGLALKQEPARKVIEGCCGVVFDDVVCGPVECP